MTVLAFPHRRAKRCNDRALELLRAEVKADLIASKNGGSRALRALEVTLRIYIAAAWLLMVSCLLVTALALPAGLAALVIWGIENLIQ